MKPPARRRDSFPALWVHDEDLCRKMGSTVVAAGLCGVDEAGRGPLAGPVVAGAVILGGDCRPAGLNDSKKVSEPERARLEGLIRGRAAAWATGRAEVEEIDRLGILPATFLAMRRAVSALDREPGFLLVDGRDYPFHPRPGRAIVKGDGLSACVAAAGILAKEERDRELRRLDLLFPGWGFARHKGYGTSVHLALLRERGRLPIHRRSFRLPWEKGAEPLPLA